MYIITIKLNIFLEYTGCILDRTLPEREDSRANVFLLRNSIPIATVLCVNFFGATLRNNSS